MPSNMKHVYIVTFFMRGEVKAFSSLAAIYDTFPKSVIGVGVTTLYNHNLEDGDYYINKQVRIQKLAVTNKKRQTK